MSIYIYIYMEQTIVFPYYTEFKFLSSSPIKEEGDDVDDTPRSSSWNTKKDVKKPYPSTDMKFLG